MEFPKINLLPEVAEIFPGLKLGCLVSDVLVDSSGDELLLLMHKEIETLSAELDAAKIREKPPIKSLKQAYKKMGKDPNRYRPAAESLLRRVIKGKELYQVNNVVDCLNLVSVKTGFSICGYDLGKIDGDVTLGKGMPEEPYEGIGRGVLNIENLPVFRDSQGAFGTPTSDSARTLIEEKTKQVLMIVPSFEGDGSELEKTMSILSEVLNKYVRTASPVIKMI